MFCFVLPNGNVLFLSDQFKLDDREEDETKRQNCFAYLSMHVFLNSQTLNRPLSFLLSLGKFLELTEADPQTDPLSCNNVTYQNGAE